MQLYQLQSIGANVALAHYLAGALPSGAVYCHRLLPSPDHPTPSPPPVPVGGKV